MRNELAAPLPSPRKDEMENTLKNEHGRRETDIIAALRETRKPADYLRRMEREDKRYAAMMEAIRLYFLPVDEYEKAQNEIVVGS